MDRRNFIGSLMALVFPVKSAHAVTLSAFERDEVEDRWREYSRIMRGLYPRCGAFQ